MSFGAGNIDLTQRTDSNSLPPIVAPSHRYYNANYHPQHYYSSGAHAYTVNPPTKPIPMITTPKNVINQLNQMSENIKNIQKSMNQVNQLDNMTEKIEDVYQFMMQQKNIANSNKSEITDQLHKTSDDLAKFFNKEINKFDLNVSLKLGKLDTNIAMKFDDYLNNSENVNKNILNNFENVNKNIHHIAITQQSNANQLNDNIQNNYNKYNNNIKDIKNVINNDMEEMKTTIDEFIFQQNNLNLNQSEAVDGNEQIRLWLQNDVKLGQYYQNFIDNGFEHMGTVQNINIQMLNAIGIHKYGHQIDIIQHCKKYKNEHPDAIYSINNNYNSNNYNNNNSFNNCNSLLSVENERLKQKLKEQNKQLKEKDQAIIDVAKSIYPSTKYQLNLFWGKTKELKKIVDQQFKVRRKKEKLTHPYIVDTTPKHKKCTKYIQKYLKNNENNGSQQLVENETDLDTHLQEKVIYRYRIVNHPRIPALNGEYGVKSLIHIGTNTVIGEYTGKNILDNDLHNIKNAEIENIIDEYGFDGHISVKLDDDQYKYFISNINVNKRKRPKSFMENELKDEDDDDDDINHNYFIQSPPLKKHKLNNNGGYMNVSNNNNNNKINKNNFIEREMNVIIDGYLMKPRSILTYINDCRKSFNESKPTKADSKHKNIELITVDINGWPRVFGIATREIKPNEELLTFYGGEYRQVQEKKMKIQQRKNKIKKILNDNNIDCSCID